MPTILEAPIQLTENSRCPKCGTKTVERDGNDLHCWLCGHIEYRVFEDKDHSDNDQGVLVDITMAGGILCLERSGVFQLVKHGVLNAQEFNSNRWWVLKSDVVELKIQRDDEAKERAEASYKHHKLKLREWHHRMTLEHRCHWCAAPVSKESANACDKHLGSMRANNKRSQEKRKMPLRNSPLCVQCRKWPKRYGYQTCVQCGLKGAQRNRERRRLRSMAKRDSIMKRGLIDVDEAANILCVHRIRVHDFIYKGILEVKEYAFRRFYLAEAAVRELKIIRQN